MARSGTSLSDDERYYSLLGDAVDALEAFQTPTPHPGIEAVLDAIRFVRAGLWKRVAHLYRE